MEENNIPSSQAGNAANRPAPSFSLPKASVAGSSFGSASPSARPASFKTISLKKDNAEKTSPLMLAIDFCAAVCAIAFTVLFFLHR